MQFITVPSSQSPISLDNVEHVIEGVIDNDQYIRNAMDAIENIIM